MILLLDNYDSFVHNLARYFRRLGCETCVVRSDRIDPADIDVSTVSAIVISPGPRTPNEAGRSLEIVAEFSSRLPMLGVCLGHQVIGQVFGATIVRSPPIHGRVSSVTHTGAGIFRSMPNPFDAARYHSLMIEETTLPTCLQVTATTSDGKQIMAVQHRELPLFGVQFHPESILTSCGFQLLAEFVKTTSLKGRGNTIDAAAGFDEELRSKRTSPMDWPSTPVTF